MKALSNYQVLYDEECPMCSIYTKALVSTGVMEADGRAAYQDLAPAACPMVDRQRAVNEIALVNQTTGEVTYGIKSLFKIFGTTIPMLKPLFSFGPFIWVMSKLYSFISYNRRVIAPPPHPSRFQLQPTFKLHYRLLYLAFTWFLTAYILTAYVHLMSGLLPQGNSYREYLICGGQLVFQGVIVFVISKDKLWNYLGNMMTISFAGTFLLLIGLLVSHWFSLPSIVYAAYFLLIAGGMLLEHIRRTKLLGLGWILSVTWVIYGILIYFIWY